jgi:signal transduction histidine kinase
MMSPDRPEEERDLARADRLARIIDGFEGELGRVARAIHDGPLQELSAVGIRLQLLRPTLAVPQQEEIDEMLAALRTASNQLRTLQFNLRPSALDGDDIAAALADLTAAHSDPSRVRQLATVPIPATTTAGARALFRAAQLLLRAADLRRHDHLDALLAPDPTGVRLTVEIGPGASGEPFTLTEAEVVGLTDRTEAAGGSFEQHHDDAFTCHVRVPRG